MYAIVEIQGQQFRVETGKKLYVHYLGDERKEGDSVEFDRVLLVDADGAVKVGAPTVEGAKVILFPEPASTNHNFFSNNHAILPQRQLLIAPPKKTPRSPKIKVVPVVKKGLSLLSDKKTLARD